MLKSYPTHCLVSGVMHDQFVKTMQYLQFKQNQLKIQQKFTLPKPHYQIISIMVNHMIEQ